MFVCFFVHSFFCCLFRIEFFEYSKLGWLHKQSDDWTDCNRFFFHYSSYIYMQHVTVTVWFSHQTKQSINEYDFLFIGISLYIVTALEQYIQRKAHYDLQNIKIKTIYKHINSIDVDSILLSNGLQLTNKKTNQIKSNRIWIVGIFFLILLQCYANENENYIMWVVSYGIISSHLITRYW